MEKLIFISYSSKDSAVAKRICKIFEKNDLNCWIAPRDVRPGFDWDEEIVDGIEQTQFFVLLLSNNSNISYHVKHELEQTKGKHILPIRIEDVEPSKRLKYYISHKHWTDAFEPPLEAKIEPTIRIIKSLHENVKDPPQPPPPQSWIETKINSPKRFYRFWQLKFLVFIAVVAAIAGYFIRETSLNEARILSSIAQGEFSAIPPKRLKNPKSPGMQRLAEQVSSPLEMQVNFIYLEDDQARLQDMSSMSILQNVELDSTRGYRFEVQVDQPSFFYLFQFEGKSTVELLFPVSSFDLENHFIQDNRLYLIPGGVNYFFLKASDTRRVVTIYLLGSLWRAKDIEKLCQFYDKAKDPQEQKEYRDQLLQQIQKRSQALEKGWKGLYIKKAAFWRN